MNKIAHVYRMCTKCIMDTSDPEITFDDDGICCHCKTYEAKASAGLYQGKAGRDMLNKLIGKGDDSTDIAEGSEDA